MRLQIVKETFANEDFHFYIKQKLPIGWTKIKTYEWNYQGETAYFETIEKAMVKVQSLIDDHMATTVVDVQVVYDTGAKK